MNRTTLIKQYFRYATIILTILSGWGELVAQAPSAQFHPRKIFIKLTSQAAAERDIQKPGAAVIGVPAIDALLKPVGVDHIRQVLTLEDANQAGGDTYGLERVFVVEFIADEEIQALVDLMETNPEVEYAEPVWLRELFFTPDDPYYDQSWHHATIQSAQAWDVETGSDTVIIAILDTGVDTDHPDLVSNLWFNPGEIPNNGIDDDGNGKVDDIHGWDFSGSIANPIEDANVNHDWGWHPNHVEDHGSHCAGIAAAVGNNIGVIGVAFTSKLMTVKIFPNPYDDVIVDAIRYAADNGADILSNSWGGETYSATAESAFLYARNTKGCVVLAAAGNNNSSNINYPAGYSGIVSVGATNSTDSRASFSNYGSWVDMCAPGVGIWSTTDPDNPYHNDHYQAWGGTSMATPVAAGVAALIRSCFSTLSVEEQEALLLDGDYVGDLQMGKRVNAYKALTTISPVELDQQLSSGQPVGSVGHWESGIFVDYTVPRLFEFEVGNTEIFRATQQIISGEKYHLWEDAPDIVNHQAFEINIQIDHLRSRLNPTHNATIEAAVPVANATVAFKDPWLIDYPDPAYGNNLRNRGMDAPFIAVEPGTDNIGINSPHQGVFLNQYPDQGPSYSIRAQAVVEDNGEWKVFSRWTGDGVTFPFPWGGDTDQETHIVFNTPDATVTAEYVPLSDPSLAGQSRTLYPDETLLLPAGTVLQMVEGFSLKIQGELLIQGTASQPVHITGAGKLSEFDPQDWNQGGVTILPNNGRALFTFSGAVFRGELNHLIISDAPVAIGLANTTTPTGGGGVLQLENVEISNANIGLLLQGPYNNTVEIRDATFTGNDLALSLGYGLEGANQTSEYTFTRCVFTGSAATAFWTTLYNTFWPEVYTSELEITVENCTFHNNGAESWVPGGIFQDVILDGAHRGYLTFMLGNNVFSSSDLWISSDPQIEDYNLFYESSFDNHTYGDSTIFADPLFVNASGGDFRLQDTSPAINRGDPDFNVNGQTWETDVDDQDPDGTRMDAGALYYDPAPQAPYLTLDVSGNNPVLNWQLTATASGYPDRDIDRFRIYKHYYISKFNQQTSYATVNDGEATSYTDYGFGLNFGTSTATYKVRAIDNLDQSSAWSNSRNTTGMVAMKPAGLPDKYQLDSAYPNPFNPSTKLDYALPVSANVDVRIYNMLGRLVYQEIAVNQPAGWYSLIWDGKDIRNNQVPSGVYLIALTARGTESREGYDGSMNFSQVQKVILMK